MCVCVCVCVCDCDNEMKMNVKSQSYWDLPVHLTCGAGVNPGSTRLHVHERCDFLKSCTHVIM